MSDQPPQTHAPQRVIHSRREYNTWVVDESIEDFALRYAPTSVRKWSLATVTNTAIATVSFLAMEVMGATLLWQYGFSNAFYALVVVALMIFATSWPISYYAAKYNVDIDLLTRGAGFGYIGSTITSLIYASFTFLFLAFESAIMALALELCFGLPLSIGYLLSALIILPLVVKGIGFINKVQAYTQPLWLFLLFVPWIVVLWKQPDLWSETVQFAGTKSGTSDFNLIYFGASCTLLFALITQVGEQVDYLRFLPKQPKQKRQWSWAVLIGGPSWIIGGFIKILAGMLLMVFALEFIVSEDQLHNPTILYWVAYQQLIDHAGLALLITTVFVCISQIKINVTNAYAGSLAWSNFFARLTHSHPGRIVWLVFNILIAILLMELGVIHAVERVLGLYSHVALAWIGAIVADLIICKPLGLSPKGIEFRRAYLYDINPVGVGSLCIASLLSMVAYFGFMGEVAKAVSGFMAIGLSMLLVPLIALLTRGKYYLARPVYTPLSLSEVQTCVVCQHDYEVSDMAPCPAYHNNICSLCCSLEARCHDLCKPKARWSAQLRTFMLHIVPRQWAMRINTRLSFYVFLVMVLSVVLAVCLSLVYFQEKARLEDLESAALMYLLPLFVKIYAVLFLLICVAAWWLVLSDESRRKAQQESNMQTQLLMDEIAAHEITDRELKDARIQAEKANDAKSRYVIGISHELRTPLNSILGYSQLIQKQENLSEQGQMAVGVISRSGQHLTSLIDGLLDLARIETGKISLNMADIHFPNFIQQITHMFAPQFAQKNLQFHTQISEKLPLYVRIDQKRLEQILINLLGNALKFTPKGAVTFKVEYRFQTAYFEICDTGCGIAAEDLERIFSPFERGRNVVQGGFSGTGLGLPIVRLLVDLLGGQLSVDSQLNQGTCFKIKLYLPSKQLIHPISNLHANTVMGYEGEPKRILVVDNEAVDRGLVANFLRPLGFIVEEAESGIHCLRQVPTFKPNLILMDLTMPLMGGWETARLLRKNQITNVPILIISANANERATNPETDVLNEDFLLKPVDLNLLLNKIGDKLGLKWIDQQPNATTKTATSPLSSAILPSEAATVQKPVSAPLPSYATSDEALLQMEKWAGQGYVRGIKQCLQFCEMTWPAQQPLWQALSQHAQRFDLKAVQHLIQEYRDECNE